MAELNPDIDSSDARGEACLEREIDANLLGCDGTIDLYARGPAVEESMAESNTDMGSSEARGEASLRGETGESITGEDARTNSESSSSITGDLDVLMAIRTLDAVEKDAQAVADSLCSLFSSLRAALSTVTVSSVEHLQCYSEVAGHVQEAALDAATKGNRFINACLRLNEEMKGMSNMAAQLKVLRQTVDHFDSQVSRLLPRL